MNEDEDSFGYYSDKLKKTFCPLFDETFHINDGDILEKTKKFKYIISCICNSCMNDTILLHFVGHGVNNDEKNIHGIAFISWNDFSNELQNIRNMGNYLIINLMNVCFSYCYKDYSAYDKLWCIDCKTIDFFTPFDIYNIESFDFNKYKQRIIDMKLNDKEIQNHYKEIIK